MFGGGSPEGDPDRGRGRRFDLHGRSSAFDGWGAVRDRNLLDSLIAKVRQDFMRHGDDMTFGTSRFIEADEKSSLPWAPRRSVCIFCNLHVMHTSEGIREVRADFRSFFDAKLVHDPGYRFQSDWYRHYATLFARD